MLLFLLALFRSALALPDCAGAHPGDPFTAYVLTSAPGPELFTVFGHSSVRVGGGRVSSDLMFNWGAFYMGEEHLVSRFLAGQLRYFLDIREYRHTHDKRVANDRSMVAQELDLPEAMARKLDQLLGKAATAKDRTYRYQWRTANCATQIRDVLDEATGGELRRQHPDSAPLLRDDGQPRTRRHEMNRQLYGHFGVWVGMNAACSAAMDEPLSEWEAMFVPDYLHDALADTSVTWPDGSERPLVKQECVLVDGSYGMPPADPVDYRWLCAVLGLMLGAVAGFAPRRVAGLAIGLLGLGAGLLGTAVLLVGLLSSFSDAFGLGPNLALLSPLTLVLVPAGVQQLRGRPTSLARWATALATLAPLALLLRVLPGMNQDNLGLVLLIWPALLGAAWGLRRRPQAPEKSTPSNTRLGASNEL